MKKLAVVIILVFFVSTSFAGGKTDSSQRYWPGSQGNSRTQLMSYPFYDWDYITDIYTDADGNTVVLRSDESFMVTSRLEHIAIACQAYALNLPLIVNWVGRDVWDAVAVMY